MTKLFSFKGIERIPLEEAIELYKSGADELAKCRRLLEDAEKAVMTVKSAEEL